ncbi:MAG TPA: hemerythrin domain-containing protein [Caulobacteraceae bacterium]|jgi:hemerythrin superfamily protein|nr:hemerythrin domain-containing protein [Caulobacteraceae bacterium]
MSLLDKVISAVTPPQSDEQRQDAHQAARSLARPGDWLSQILDHHEAVEEAFARVRAAGDAQQRRAAQKWLGAVLNGHAMAEEAVIYPALAHVGEKASAESAYAEQVAAKQQLAALDRLDPMSQDYLEKLGSLEGAVFHHVYEEEHLWFPKLKQTAPPADQEIIAQRYREEFERYMGPDIARVGHSSDGLPPAGAGGRETI